MRVLISMPDKFLENIDKLADEEGRTRSELIREAVRTYADRQLMKKQFASNPIERKWYGRQNQKISKRPNVS